MSLACGMVNEGTSKAALVLTESHLPSSVWFTTGHFGTVRLRLGALEASILGSDTGVLTVRGGTGKGVTLPKRKTSVRSNEKLCGDGVQRSRWGLEWCMFFIMMTIRTPFGEAQ